MASLRQHGTTLITGLVVLGVLGIVASSVNLVIGLSPIVRGVIWFVAAFLAAHVARRALLQLETGSLYIAAVVVIMIAVGIERRRDGEPVDVTILVQIALTLAGTFAGALTSKRPSRVRLVAAVLAAGAACFGAAVLGVGLATLVGIEQMLYGLLIASLGGAFLATLFVPEIEAAHTAAGQGLYFGVISGVFGVTEIHNGSVGDNLLALAMSGGLGGAVGWLFGALGGAVGARLRTEAPPATELPEARRID